MEPQPAIHYDFVVPTKIVFGWGRRCEVGSLLRAMGRRCFVLWGSRTLAASGVGAEILSGLEDAGLEVARLTTIDHEPEVEDVDATVHSLHDQRAGAHDVVLAIGGGSAMDLAKAAAALATNRGSATVKDYLEGVGRGLEIVHPPLPLLVMPTTAGTGSEATKNAVISSYNPPFKKSLRSELMLPRCVVVDPELTISMPPAVTAQSGMDAVTQLIESYISRRARPIPQALALQGLRMAVPALVQALRQPHHRQAREAMSHAALLSGMALANSGLGLAHGVAAALGVHCRVPHGLACGVMLPWALRVNRVVCTTQYAELAGALGLPTEPSPAVAADSFVDLIQRLCREVGLPSHLADLGVRREQIPDLIRSSRGNSMDGNPRLVSDEELAALLEEAL
jgi:alcohol dehydrogenase class IV